MSDETRADIGITPKEEVGKWVMKQTEYGILDG
jgi:hypothetical protein